MADKDDIRCTCVMRAPVVESVILSGGYNKYATYLTMIEDESVIDPTCPYHGENGTMVLKINTVK